MPRNDGSPLDPIQEEAFDGVKYTTELKPIDHKHNFTKISPTEIRCNCGAGYSGNNIDTLLKLLTSDK